MVHLTKLSRILIQLEKWTDGHICCECFCFCCTNQLLHCLCTAGDPGSQKTRRPATTVSNRPFWSSGLCRVCRSRFPGRWEGLGLTVGYVATVRRSVISLLWFWCSPVFFFFFFLFIADKLGGQMLDCFFLRKKTTDSDQLRFQERWKCFGKKKERKKMQIIYHSFPQVPAAPRASTLWCGF